MGCSSIKDMAVLESSPHAEEDGLVSGPVSPLFVVGCRGEDRYRAVVVCHECYHRLEVDMWISDRCWSSLNPRVPYDRLPIEFEGKDSPETYAKWCDVEDVPLICCRCGAETSNRWPSDESVGLCNGLPLVPGSLETEAAYVECTVRRLHQDAMIRREHERSLYERVAAAYGGLPLALVEVVPEPGDTIEWPPDANGETPVGGVTGSGGRTVSVDLAGRFTTIYDAGSGLSAFEPCGKIKRYSEPDVPWGEKDGYSLRLVTPERPPGQRAWKLLRALDRLRPDVVSVDVVSTIVVRGAGFRSSVVS